MNLSCLYEKLDCVLADIATAEQVDQVHSFDEDGRCRQCGWSRTAILADPRFKPWLAIWFVELGG